VWPDRPRSDRQGHSGGAAVSANLTSYELNALYHTPIITDIEGEGSSDIVMAAGYEGLFVLRKDGSALWRRVTVPWDLYSRQPGVADVDGDGVREIGISHKDGLFEAIDALTGSTKWSYGLPAASGNIATCDIAGTGQAQYVLGTTNGELLALNGAANAQSRVLWTLNLHRGLGDVVIADALSTGASQVLVTASDGYLYIIDQASPQTLRAMVRMLQEDLLFADSVLADRLLHQADYPTAFKETLLRSKAAALPETARNWLLKSADDVLNASAAARAGSH